MTVDEIVKLVLAFSLSFGIVGISWYIMGLLRTFSNILEDTRVLIYQVSGFMEKFDRDYDRISIGLFGALNPIMDSFKNVSKPISAVLNTVANLLRRNI